VDPEDARNYLINFLSKPLLDRQRAPEIIPSDPLDKMGARWAPASEVVAPFGDRIPLKFRGDGAASTAPHFIKPRFAWRQDKSLTQTAVLIDFICLTQSRPFSGGFRQSPNREAPVNCTSDDSRFGLCWPCYRPPQPKPFQACLDSAKTADRLNGKNTLCLRLNVGRAVWGRCGFSVLSDIPLQFAFGNTKQ